MNRTPGDAAGGLPFTPLAPTDFPTIPMEPKQGRLRKGPRIAVKGQAPRPLVRDP